MLVFAASLSKFSFTHSTNPLQELSKQSVNNGFPPARSNYIPKGTDKHWHKNLFRISYLAIHLVTISNICNAASLVSHKQPNKRITQPSNILAVTHSKRPQYPFPKNSQKLETNDALISP